MTRQSAAAALFALLSTLYLIQLILSYWRAKVPVDAKRPDGTTGRISLTDALPHFDGGFQNTIWVFLILGIFLPIALTSLNDTVAVLGDSPPNEPIRTVPLLYFVYVSAITVIITLEFSYIHNLRNGAPEWIPFLLVAVVLDFTTLLVFAFVLRHPDTWTVAVAIQAETAETTSVPFPMGPITQSAMLLTTVIAVLSSIVVLVLARAAGALHANQINFPFTPVVTEPDSPDMIQEDAMHDEET